MPRNSRSRSRRAIAAAALCLLFAGCGDDRGRVTGAVTLDGQPLRAVDGVTASVMFQPTAGGAAGVGLVDAQGQYRVSTGTQAGVVPGDYVITSSATQVIPSPTGGAASGKALLDPKYTNGDASGLAFKVVPGDNVYNVDLTSLKGKSAAAR